MARGNATAAAILATGAKNPGSAMQILHQQAAEYPQIVDFDATGMTAEQRHYFLGEDAGVAYDQYQNLKGERA